MGAGSSPVNLAQIINSSRQLFQAYLLHQMSATLTKTKAAWIRCTGYPVGSPAPGHINCPCKKCPQSYHTPGPDIFCDCGTVYGWDGEVKGRVPHFSFKSVPINADSEKEAAEILARTYTPDRYTLKPLLSAACRMTDSMIFTFWVIPTPSTFPDADVLN